MISNRELAIALGIGICILLLKFGKSRQQGRHYDKKLHKKEMHTWEGEGGNILPGFAAKQT